MNSQWGVIYVKGCFWGRIQKYLLLSNSFLVFYFLFFRDTTSVRKVRHYSYSAGWGMKAASREVVGARGSGHRTGLWLHPAAPPSEVPSEAQVSHLGSKGIMVTIARWEGCWGSHEAAVGSAQCLPDWWGALNQWEPPYQLESRCPIFRSLTFLEPKYLLCCVYNTPPLSSVLRENQSPGGKILCVSIFCCSYRYIKVIDFIDFLLTT